METPMRFVLGALAMAMGLSAPALQAADFYKDKTVTIIVGFTPGGGYDVYARQLARFLPDHIPGRPNIVVQNMPGAGSLTAVRAVGTTQPKDGTVMVIFNPGLITQSVVEPEKVPFDFRRYAFVGTVTPDFRVCYGYGPNGVKTWEEMMKRKEWIIGGTGKGSGNYVNGATLREVFNAPVRQILGFPGSAEQRLAMERGELDGAIDDFVTTQEQRDVLAVLSADEIGRPFAMSRDVPADRLAILRKAFDDLMADQNFRAEMTRLLLPVYPINGPDSDKIVAKMLDVKPDVAVKARKIFQ
jgi:tripartite-type tricarboxylate transporter receptor subunit TctC